MSLYILLLTMLLIDGHYQRCKNSQKILHLIFQLAFSVDGALALGFLFALASSQSLSLFNPFSPYPSLSCCVLSFCLLGRIQQISMPFFNFCCFIRYNGFFTASSAITYSSHRVYLRSKIKIPRIMLNIPTPCAMKVWSTTRPTGQLICVILKSYSRVTLGMQKYVN